MHATTVDFQDIQSVTDFDKWAIFISKYCLWNESRSGNQIMDRTPVAQSERTLKGQQRVDNRKQRLDSIARIYVECAIEQDT
jgi:hypothetical protein